LSIWSERERHCCRPKRALGHWLAARHDGVHGMEIEWLRACASPYTVPSKNAAKANMGQRGRCAAGALCLVPGLAKYRA